jgi:hypothetical protein
MQPALNERIGVRTEGLSQEDPSEYPPRKPSLRRSIRHP